MTDKKARCSTDGKIRIVLQTFNPETKVAELCREHNLAPRTLYTWKERFLQGGRESLGSPGSGRTLKRHAREVEILKRIIGKYAVANDALKKTSVGSTVIPDVPDLALDANRSMCLMWPSTCT